ncbi:LysR substrate-binding domain-containing protein [Propionivibrio limicola]|uniref:LysR substrate-binding domain-containing protein n=1 Tax=Propionivibrio limicola TaxID=167645 RepID=UPI001B87C217|nr:LysR substrate-binding domain-containing protein [Propionivibrio limicola]
MDNLPALSDLSLFCVAARRSSFVATATELGKSSAFVSKRIAILEKTLGVKLFHRTTRQVAITEDGESVFQWAQQILEAANGLTEMVGGRDVEPKGMVRITSNFRIGRLHLAPLLSELEQRHPGLEIWLEAIDRPVDLIRDGIDIDIRIGTVTEPHLFAHRIVESRRILCAAPSYLEKRGVPKSLNELSQHACLVLRERDQAFGVWRLDGPNGLETVKATGSMSTNNGDVARVWAHAGQGIFLVSDRDVADSLANGELVHILPDYFQPADVWAVCRTRLSDSLKLRVCVEFLREQLTSGPYALVKPKVEQS